MTLLSARPERRAPTNSDVENVDAVDPVATVDTVETVETSPTVQTTTADQPVPADRKNARGDSASSAKRRNTLMLVLILGVLSALGPLATDLYLPALPQIASDLGASEASVKLTLTSVMAGMSLGQLVIGPLSDRLGRRLPLLVGIGMFTVSTVAIALVSSVEMFSLLRFVQGLSAAAGLVVSRAIVRDVFDGDAAATFFSRLVLLAGLAPMLGPILGGQLLFFGPWQLLFTVLGAAGLLTFALVLFFLPESLPVEERQRVSPRAQMRVFGRLLRDIRFTGPTLTLTLSFAMSFTYISTFSFVSHSRFGASAQEFSLVFAVTTLGMILGNQVNAFLIGRMEIQRRLFLGLAGSIVSVVALAVLDASGHADLVTVTAALFVMMVFTGLVSPNATALALNGQPPKIAGSGSALLGTLQFAIGSGLAATPGMFGSVTLGSMTAVMIATAVAAAVVFTAFAVRVRHAAPVAV